MEEQAKISRTLLSLKEQYCLAKYLDIDNDCLIKKDFLERELKKVFHILDQGQVRALNLLEKDDRKYQKHFEVLKRGMSIGEEQDDICPKILKVLRDKMIPSQKWFDSLGFFLVEEFANLDLDQNNDRIFITPELFRLFLQTKWNHKINEKIIKEILNCLHSRQSRSLKNLEDGMFYGGEKEKMNIIEMVLRMEMLLRFQQKSQLAGFRMCVFAILLQEQGLTPRKYFLKQGINNLNKKIELFQFHFHNSTHLKFKLEDSDSEFIKLDPEQRNRVKYVDFVKKIEDIQNRIPNSVSMINNSRVMKEKNESNLRQSQHSKMSNTSRRKINRKSKIRNFNNFKKFQIKVD